MTARWLALRFLGGVCVLLVFRIAADTRRWLVRLSAAASDNYLLLPVLAQMPQIGEAGTISPQQCAQLCARKSDPRHHQYFDPNDDITALTSILGKHAYMTLADIASNFELQPASILTANNSYEIIHSCLRQDRVLIVYFTTGYPRVKLMRADLAFLQNLTIPHVVLTIGPGHVFRDEFELQTINNPYLIRWYGPSQVHGPGDKGDESTFHERAYPLPLGLTSSEYDPMEQLQFVAKQLKSTISVDTKDKLVLINFGPAGSGKSQYRSPPYNRFCNQTHSSYSNEFNQTCTASGGFFNRQLWPKGQRRSQWAAVANETYANWSRHKYTVSPRGQQADCHRFWEALYLKSVPIVLSSEVYYQNLVQDYFLASHKNFKNLTLQDLPILFVNSWNDVTKELLDTEWDRRFRRILQDPWPPHYLTLDHTKAVIEEGVKEEVSKRAQLNPAIWGALQQRLSSGERGDGLWEDRKRCYN